MNLRITARLVGVLFLAAMVGSLVGGVAFIEPYLTATDVLTAVSENETQVIIGVFLELINGLAVLGIGILMFSVFKRHSAQTAIGYLGFRIVEAVFCCAIVIAPLSLITLGQASATVGADYQAAVALAIANRASISGLLIPIFFGLGSLLLYRALYQFKLLPRFITIWGFVGAALILLMNVLLTFGVELGDIGMVMALPIILNEVFLGIWLIVKGFKPSELSTGPITR